MYSFASADVLAANKAAVKLAFQAAFAQYVGHTGPIDPEIVKVEFAWNGVAYAQIFLTDPQTMNKTEMTSSMFTIPLTDYQAEVNASLTSSGVALADLGLSVTFAGDPTGPYGSYGYGYQSYS